MVGRACGAWRPTCSVQLLRQVATRAACNIDVACGYAPAGCAGQQRRRGCAAAPGARSARRSCCGKRAKAASRVVGRAAAPGARTARRSCCGKAAKAAINIGVACGRAPAATLASNRPAPVQQRLVTGLPSPAQCSAQSLHVLAEHCTCMDLAFSHAPAGIGGRQSPCNCAAAPGARHWRRCCGKLARCYWGADNVYK